MDHSYWGPSATPEEIATAIAARRADFDAAGCTIERIGDEASLCRRTAQAISEGKVIGWFQGRMEWGPRALGNRSILGDPRRADMKDIPSNLEDQAPQDPSGRSRRRSCAIR